MKRTTFFAVMANVDQTEGRGPMRFTGIGFEHKADALSFVRSQDYAKRWGVMGTPGSDYCVEEMSVSIYANFEEGKLLLGEQFKEERRLAALRKLNDEDRKVLGL